MTGDVGALGRELAEACKDFGQQPAIMSGEQWTYAELLNRAERLADEIRSTGQPAHEPIGVMVSNEPADIAAILGIWLVGAVAVPVHRTTPDQLRAQIVERTACRLVVDTTASTTLLRTGLVPPPRPLLRGAALIVFTSGSTGVPKGVVVGHDEFAAKIRQIDHVLRFGTGERTLLVLNITFSFGMWVSLLTLFRGGILHMQQRFEPVQFLQELVRSRITRVGMVPTMMRVLFGGDDHAELLGRVDDAGTLRQVMMGGEALSLSLAQRIRSTFGRTDLIDIYGLTETATCDFFALPEDFRAEPGSIGRAAPGVEYRIASPDEDGIGELQIRSPFLMRGYLDDPVLTAAAYDEGWFRTGDLARGVEEERVILHGRAKDLISRGGNKVTPAEVEGAIGSFAEVAAVLVAGVPDDLLGERIGALIVPRNAASFDEAALRHHLSERLERFKHPDLIRLADEIPVGRTGKADRGSLRSLFTADTKEI